MCHTVSSILGSRSCLVLILLIFCADTKIGYVWSIPDRKESMYRRSAHMAFLPRFPKILILSSALQTKSGTDNNWKDHFLMLRILIIYYSFNSLNRICFLNILNMDKGNSVWQKFNLAQNKLFSMCSEHRVRSLPKLGKPCYLFFLYGMKNLRQPIYNYALLPSYSPRLCLQNSANSNQFYFMLFSFACCLDNVLESPVFGWCVCYAN